MSRARSKTKRETRDSGASLVEYALLVVLIAIMGIASVEAMTGEMRKVCCTISATLADAVYGGDGNGDACSGTVDLD
jgi:Flp pilus assembly pilin Flp